MNEILNHYTVKTNDTNNRNSSIDLLKIIAILLIVLCHTIPYWENDTVTGLINIYNSTNSVNEFLVILISYLGQIGNCLFVICSAYFLIDNDKVKIKKVLSIVIDTFFISVAIMIIFILNGQMLTIKEIIKNLLPITFNNNWFVGCYILYYIIHPVLNKFINSINQKQLLTVNIFLIVYFCIIQFAVRKVYTPVIGFIVIYFLVAYMKKYMKHYMKNININYLLLILSIVVQILSLIILNFLGLHYSSFGNKMRYMAYLYNPLTIIASLSIFNIISNKKIMNNKINYVASLTLLIYIIHENILIRNYIRSAYFEKIYITIGYNYIVPITICSGILVFIASVFISIIYKNTIQKITKKISDLIYEKGSIYFNKVIDMLVKIN